MQSLSARRPTARQAKRDPAPSKWAYRMHRMLLRPWVRMFLRTGLPTLIVVGAASAWISHEPNRTALVAQLTHLRAEFEARPEFRVSLARVEGASPELAEAVRARLALPLPMSSFDIDLESARLRIEGLNAVLRADLRVRAGGVLQVLITEREPVAVWRTEDGLMLVDETGHRVAGLLSRSDRPDLPLVAGEGAERMMPEALALFDAAGPLTPRIRGLVRLGERRWDIVLDRKQPRIGPEYAQVGKAEPLR